MRYDQGEAGPRGALFHRETGAIAVSTLPGHGTRMMSAIRAPSLHEKSIFKKYSDKIIKFFLQFQNRMYILFFE